MGKVLDEKRKYYLDNYLRIAESIHGIVDVAGASQSGSIALLQSLVFNREVDDVKVVCGLIEDGDVETVLEAGAELSATSGATSAGFRGGQCGQDGDEEDFVNFSCVFLRRMR